MKKQKEEIFYIKSQKIYDGKKELSRLWLLGKYDSIYGDICCKLPQIKKTDVHIYISNDAYECMYMCMLFMYMCIDGLHLFWFCKLACMCVNHGKWGELEYCVILESEDKKQLRRSQLIKMVNFC